MATGKVIGALRSRRRASEFKRFLARIEAAVPNDLAVHRALDNYGTHET